MPACQTSWGPPGTDRRQWNTARKAISDLGIRISDWRGSGTHGPRGRRGGGRHPASPEALWSGELSARNAIVHLMSCFSSAGGADSVASNVGGRVVLAYPDIAWSSHELHNNHLFFLCLNGYQEGGTRRTAGKAYGDGSQYGSSMVMLGATGKEWTTLNPAPNAVFPQGPAGGRKGAGCMISDTYMDDSVSADLAVQKVSANAPFRPGAGSATGADSTL